MQDFQISNLKSQISNSKVAFLWDESFLWGLMAHKALTRLGLPFNLVTAKDIQGGVLDKYKMLFVPGGWASNKSKTLGEAGIKNIRNFVENGGNYLGFCGGAGLATNAMGGLGLLNIKRLPTKERVPSFSGRIKLDLNDHKIWSSTINSPLPAEGEDPSPITHHLTPVFHAWWPSQFIIEDDEVKVLASYSSALPDSFSSDLNVGDVENNGSWEGLEKVYKINLDPGRLIGEPAVIEGCHGKGKVILSLLHFDTPDDTEGGKVLASLWEYLAYERYETNLKCIVKEKHSPDFKRMNIPSHMNHICTDLISLGKRNFLWFWRNSMLLQWRRGVRGLEYNTLYIMMNEILSLIAEQRTRIPDRQAQIKDTQLDSIEELLVPFIEKAKRLLVLERHELQKGNFITFGKCDNAEINGIRTELFSESKSHGGLFKELIDRVDTLLYYLLTHIIHTTRE